MNNSQIALICVYVIVLILALSINQKRHIRGNANANKKESIALFIVSICLFIISYTRPEEMADYHNYVGAYINDYSERFEPSFNLIRDVCHRLQLGYLGVFAIFAAISIGIKTFCISRMSNLLWLSVLVWISSSFILMDMITMRASVAVGFMLLAIKYKEDGNKFKLLCAIILAVLFHYSAAVLFIIPFLSSNKSYKKFYIWIIPICMLIQLSGLTISHLIPSLGISEILNLYNRYEDDSTANLFNLLSIGRCIIAIFLWIKYNCWYGKNRYALLALKVYTIGCSLFMLLGDLLRVAFRLGELLWCTDIIVYPLLTFCVSRKAKPIWTIVVSLIFFCITVTKISYWNPNSV